MGLLDGLFGGGGAEDDPYADILTPAQRRQMQTQGLLAMAGAFADAGMPSRLPIPFGAALGKAAAALGTGQEAGMKAAIENALAAQKVRDLRSLSQFRTQFFGDQNTLNDRVRDLITPGAAPAGRSPAAAPAGTYIGTGSGGAPADGGGLLSPDFALGSDYASGVTAPQPGGVGRFAGGGPLDYPAATGGLSVGGGGLLSAPAESDIGLGTPSSRYQPGGDLDPFKQLGTLPLSAGAPAPAGAAASSGTGTSGYLQPSGTARTGGYQFYGDSVAHGTRKAAGAGGVTRGGWRPDQVLGSLEGANPQGDTVVISSGITNSTATGLPRDQWQRDIALVPQQIAAARQSGAGNIVLYGVGGGVRDGDQINAELRRIADQNGVSFVPLVGTGAGWHPKDYNAQFDYTRTQLGAGSGATPTPVPSVTSVPGGTNGIVPRGFSGSSGLLAEPDSGAGGDPAPVAPDTGGGGLLGVSPDLRAPIEANPVARVDAVLAQIRQRESGGNYAIPPERNVDFPRSHASGGYQFQPGTWREWTQRSGYGTEYPEAYRAPPQVQDAVARYAALHGDVNASNLWGASAGNRPYPSPFEGGGRPPDELIPSGPTAGARPPITPAQYAAPGAGGAPMPAAPGASQIPQIQAPPGADPAKFNALLLELARRNAAAEVLGLGNPYGSLLSVLQGSPQYKAAVEAATETARHTAGIPFIKEEKRLGAEGEEPSKMRIDANKAVLDQINKDAEQAGAAALEPAPNGILLRDPATGGLIRVPGTKYQQALVTAGFDVPELNFKGINGPPPSRPNIPGLSSSGTQTTRTPAAPGGAGGLTPAGEPVLNPGQTKSQEVGATQGWKAIEDTHAAEVAANRSDQQLGQIAQAMQGFTPGATAEWRLKGGQLLKDLGFKVDGVSDGEIMQQAIRRVQLAGAAVHQGSVSNYERSLYAEGYEQLTNSPEGLAKAIAIGQRLNAYDKQVAAIHRDAMQNGVPNVIEAQRRIAALGPPLSPGEISALEQIRAGKVPRTEQATGPVAPDQHPAMRAQAADAIAKGAPRDGVIKRLQSMGVSTEGL